MKRHLLAIVSILLLINSACGKKGTSPTLVLPSEELKISSINGRIVPDSILTISGSDFGTKAKAAPKIWDNFDNGTDGATLVSVDTSWHDYYGNQQGGKYSSIAKYSGRYSINNYYGKINQTTIPGSQEFGTNYKTYFPASDTFYCIYKVYYNYAGTISSLSQIKYSRAASNYNGPLNYVSHYNGPGRLGISALFYHKNSYLYYNNGDGKDDVTFGTVYFTYIDTGSWHTIEMYTELGVHGKMFVIVDGTVIYQNMDLVTRASGQAFQMNSFLLGIMLANTAVDNTADHRADAYIDDVYVDNTPARVFIAANPNGSGNREIQIPISWSNNAIAIKFNLGAFGTVENKYLFVVDSKGNMSNGLLLSGN